MPHLHYELRSGPGIRGVEGLPGYFEDYVLRRGARTIDVQRGVPGTGDIVERR